MPGPILHQGAGAQCPHGGQVTLMAAQTRVRVGGQPVYTVNDPSMITGCPFPGSAPLHPCVRVRWLAPSTRVRVLGQAVVLRDTSALAIAIDEAPQGAPILTSSQMRARAR